MLVQVHLQNIAQNVGFPSKKICVLVFFYDFCRMKKLVIFDLDGTLLETLSDLARSVNYALSIYNYPIHILEDYKFFVGNGVDKLIERVLPLSERTVSVKEKVKKAFMLHYSKHKQDKTMPYKGMINLIEELKKRGVKMAVATNKFHEASVELVEFYFGKNTFDMILGQIDSRPVKPNPEIVFEILNFVEVLAADSLYVGDSAVDMCTAQNSGIESVGVTWGFRSEEELISSGAVHIAHKPSDILMRL